MKRMSLLACMLLVIALVASIAVAGCGSSDSEEATKSTETAAGTGILEFTANGEDFVREGFTSKDGWNLKFQHLYATLANVAAYQTDPPYDAEEGWEMESVEEVELAWTHTADLVGTESEPIVVLGEVNDAPAGQYNAISWEMVHAGSGESAGYTYYLVGTAEKEGQTIQFTIKLSEQFAFQGGEYVGDERKGFLEDGETADVEMTFHFDHLFGDAETPADDSLNVDALGFDPFATLAANGVLDVDSTALKSSWSAEQTAKLDAILPTLGHVGEGHCVSKPLEQQ